MMGASPPQARPRRARPARRWPPRVATAPLAALLLMATTGASLAQRPDSRITPPAAAECPRDRLTLYSGLVLRYRRSADRTVIRIRTEWQTTEEVTISHPGSDDPSRWFLLDPTLNSAPVLADTLSQDRYIPLFSFSKDTTYRHAATSLKPVASNAR